MTRDFETKTMKPMEIARHHAGLKRNDRRSVSYPGRKFDHGSDTSEEVQINPSEHPGFLAFPKLKRIPSIMTGDWLKTIYDLDVAFIPAYPVRAPYKPANFGLEITIDMPAFFRTLAKIAHCLTVAKYGLGNFEPMLLDIIHGVSVENAGYLIGRCDDPAMNVPTRHLHHCIVQEFWINKERHYIAVMFRLFANKGAPPYTLVSGQLPGAPTEEYRDDPEDSE